MSDRITHSRLLELVRYNPLWAAMLTAWAFYGFLYAVAR